MLCLVTHSRPTLFDPCTAACQAYLSIGILQPGILSGLPCPPPFEGIKQQEISQAERRQMPYDLTNTCNLKKTTEK